MLNRIKQLEKVANGLEPSVDDREVMTGQARDFAESFLEKLPDANTFAPNTGQSKLLDHPFTEEAGEFPGLLDTLESTILREGIQPASGGHMGYIPGGGIYPAALGDFLADVTNCYSGVSFASPGGVRMEQLLVKWMTGLVGFPSNSGGDLTSGGSVANLTAIVTARETMGIRARDVDNSCIYMTADAHHCLDKSIRAAGLADCKKRLVPMDEHFRMDAVALERMIREDQVSGLRPWLIISSAGTTDTGAVDPIAAVADLAEQHRPSFTRFLLAG